MPLVKISIRKGRSEAEKKNLLQIVHRALVEAFKIPDNDRVQRIYEFDDHDFEIPHDRSDKFTIIELTILPGRSLEAKKKLYAIIFKHLKDLGYQDSDAVVVLNEPELINWGVRGGLAASEVDLDYDLDV